MSGAEAGQLSFDAIPGAAQADVRPSASAEPPRPPAPVAPVLTSPGSPLNDHLPRFVRENYEVREWREAGAILRSSYPAEWNDILEVLTGFRLLRSAIQVGGKNKSLVSNAIDAALYGRGWRETKFHTTITTRAEVFDRPDRTRKGSKTSSRLLDPVTRESPTHKVDCFRNKVGLEIEWNNKDPFYDRDLNNFRLLFELHVLNVGVIVTRSDELQQVVDELGRGKSYGNSTTHMSKLVPRLDGAAGGGCPVLVFGISRSLYVDDVGLPPPPPQPAGDEDEDEDE